MDTNSATTATSATNGAVPAAVKEAANVDDKVAAAPVDLSTLPTRAYLDKTVVPILLEGLANLSKERPPNPIEWLAAYLMKNKDSKPEGK
eukprot:m.1190863 g.1190863  ORF g.1190863 m.1190863 type:complete len:90 (-) comp24556_c1_seq25:2923-3192(-)